MAIGGGEARDTLPRDPAPRVNKVEMATFPESSWYSFLKPTYSDDSYIDNTVDYSSKALISHNLNKNNINIIKINEEIYYNKNLKKNK